MHPASAPAEYQAAFSAAQAALGRLQRASLASRMSATWYQSQEAQHLLAEAREFDSHNMPQRGGRHARHR